VVLTCGNERLEQPVTNRARNSGARVLYIYQHDILRLPRAYADLPRDPKTVMAALRSELPMIDSNLEALVEDSRTAFSNQPAFVLSRIGAIGSTIIGVLALLMASVGIYGMVGFAVSQRTHEVGVRMALGACGGDVLGLVLRKTMRPVVIGLGTGIAGAAMVSHILSSMLFGLSTLDPLTYLGVSTFLAVVALLAGYVPARRATKVDPMVALRHE